MTLALLALAVWMPATNPDVSAEIKRLQPEVVIATYTGSTITRQPGEAVVLLGEIGADNRVGVALGARLAVGAELLGRHLSRRRDRLVRVHLVPPRSIYVLPLRKFHLYFLQNQ